VLKCENQRVNQMVRTCWVRWRGRWACPARRRPTRRPPRRRRRRRRRVAPSSWSASTGAAGCCWSPPARAGKRFLLLAELLGDRRVASLVRPGVAVVRLHCWGRRPGGGLLAEVFEVDATDYT
jgi:hypothetical protein